MKRGLLLIDRGSREREAEEEANRILSELQVNTLQEFAIEIEAIISYGTKYNCIVDLINEDNENSVIDLSNHFFDIEDGVNLNYSIQSMLQN